MAVKRIQSAARVLSVLEAVARNQPIGVSDLARLLADDKSAVQRAVMTLADEGWIRSAPQTSGKWELTGRLHGIARVGHSNSHILSRAHATLLALRDEFDETALLTAVNNQMLVLIDVVESGRMLRYVPPVGMVIDPRDSAAGNALLPHMTLMQQQELLGTVPDEKLLQSFATTLSRGYSTSDGLLSPDTVSLAAAILEEDGRPLAALVMTGPPSRMTPERQEIIGARLAHAAKHLS